MPKDYEIWLALDKVIATISKLTVWPTLYIQYPISTKYILYPAQTYQALRTS